MYKKFSQIHRFCCMSVMLGCGVSAAEITAPAKPEVAQTNPIAVVAVQSGSDAKNTTSNLMIGKRIETHAGSASDNWLITAATISKRLATDTTALSDADLMETIRYDKVRSGTAFAKLLDPKIGADPSVRKGAAIGIRISEAPSKIVSKALASAALIESNTEARKAVISTIQERKDTAAVNSLLTTLGESTDPDGLGYTNQKQRDAALDALHDIGDKRVYQALLYHVTSEVRFGLAQPVALDKIYITNSGDTTGGAVGRTAVNLPIDLPTIELTSVQTNITMPAISQPFLALKKVAGEDFGRNAKKWNNWIEKQPDFRK
jgi:hypothetical protein